MLKKTGTKVKINVVKKSGFSLDPNLIAAEIEKKWPGGKKVSIDQLHEAVKSIGVIDYSDDDMQDLVGLLQSTGFTVTH